MKIELKPIAESKVRQLGGDVCGVLVRNDGKLAAVDEHGRVQWLQDGQGVEPVAEVWPSHHFVRQNHVNWLVDVDDLPNDALLYLSPQPAQQGGVPEEWKAAAKGAAEFADDEQMVRDCPGVAAETIKELANLILAASTQPQKEGEGDE